MRLSLLSILLLRAALVRCAGWLGCALGSVWALRVSNAAQEAPLQHRGSLWEVPAKRVQANGRGAAACAAPGFG